ncbi:MAG: hypothetical protein OXC91_00715 [Rhodobacteraceae bacterium]|nr:hypothetical protein [Paracoccaceae bacterium]
MYRNEAELWIANVDANDAGVAIDAERRRTFCGDEIWLMPDGSAALRAKDRWHALAAGDPKVWPEAIRLEDHYDPDSVQVLRLSEEGGSGVEEYDNAVAAMENSDWA